MRALVPLWLLFACTPDGTDTAKADRDGDGSLAEADCDDADPRRTPGAEEVCDRLDNDCDELVDEADPDLTDGGTWFVDADGDGAGDGLNPVAACARADGHAASAGDCDDSDPTVTTSSEWYADTDGDGYGDAAEVATACGPPVGHVADATDCDDGAPGTNPGAVEECGDGIDQDCDGTPNGCGPSGDAALEADERTLDGSGRLGLTLAAVGDSPVIAVGEPDGDEGGAVSLWTWDDGGWDDGAYLEGEAGTAAGTLLAARDVDGDGARDLLVGATGAAWLVHGPFDDDMELEDADARYAPAEPASFVALAALGDQDGDGVGDVLLASAGGTDTVGYVASGAADGDTDDTDALATFVAGPSFVASGAADLGDLDGDGVDDAALVNAAATETLSSQGVVYVLAGPVLGELAVPEAAVHLLGEQVGGGTGMTVHGPGDVDGDGYADVLVGAPAMDTLDVDNGAAWLVRGPVSATLDLADATWILRGSTAYEELGRSFVAADLDDDGRTDLAVGGGGDANNRGVVVICRSPSAGELRSSEADARLLGTATNDEAGAALLGVGDLDGDDDAELLVGAPGASGGSVFVVPGGRGL